MSHVGGTKSLSEQKFYLTFNAMKFMTMLGVWLLSALCTFGQIIETESVDEIAKHVTQDAIVLVDCDNTLWQSSTSWGHGQWFDALVAENIAKGMERYRANIEAWCDWHEAQWAIGVQAVDKKLIQALNVWSKKGHLVLALTARSAHNRTDTLAKLKEVGVHLTSVQTMILEGHSLKGDVLVTGGCIFAHDSRNTKSMAFDALSRKLGLQPKRLILIDDSRRHVEDMERYCQLQKIEFVGIVYTKIQKVSIYDGRVAAVQRDVFRKTGKVLSDDEMRHMLGMEREFVKR